MNRPYVKQYDANGDLLNPIVDYFSSKRVTKDFPSGFPNRRERRAVLVNSPRGLSNKKGLQLVVTNLGRGRFMKHKRTTQKIEDKTIIHYKQI